MTKTRTTTRTTERTRTPRTTKPERPTAAPPAAAPPIAQGPDPQPGDYDDIIEDLEPVGYGPAFYDGRSIPEGLLAIVGPPPTPAELAAEEAARPPGVAVSVRLEHDILRRLRTLAAVKGTKYQTLLKTFVAERLYEEERREGLVGGGTT